LRPDLRQWLLRLIDKMSLESLQSLRAWEQNNELRCQVLEKIFALLDEGQLQSDDYAAILKDILTNCSLSESARYRYEQLLQSYLSGVERPSFTVGCLLPLTGEYSDYGNKILLGMELALQVFNDNLREYAAANGKILFDLADIESYLPDGTPCYGIGVDGAPVDVITVCDEYVNERVSGHLNAWGSNRVAQAIWVMMAQLAGWDGE